MVVPFGCIHSIAEQSITAQIPNWLKEKLLKKKNYALLLTGFCLAEASKKTPMTSNKMEHDRTPVSAGIVFLCPCTWCGEVCLY